MSNHLKQPLSTLAQESPEVSTCKVSNTKVFTSGNFVSYIIWFIIIAIVVWIILVASHPTWVQNYNELGQPTGVVDQAKAITWAIIIALIIVIIIWIVRAFSGGKRAKEEFSYY